MKKKLKAQTFQLPESTLTRLRKAAPELEMPQQEIVDLAVNAYLDAIKNDAGKNV